MKKLLRQVILGAAVAAASLVVYLVLGDWLVMPFIVNVEKVVVPQLVDQDTTQARGQLAQLGLRLAIRDSVYYEQQEAGLITEQEPAAHQQIKRGRRVFVDISRGAQLYPVPDLRQASLRQARFLLEGSHLTLGEVAYRSSPTVPRGAVLEQGLAPGTLHPRQTRVPLHISSGDPQAPKRVPQLVGATLDSARHILHLFELQLGRVTQQRRRGQEPGTVLEQQPLVDQRLPRSSPVDVLISAWPPTHPDSSQDQLLQPILEKSP